MAMNLSDPVPNQPVQVGARYSALVPERRNEHFHRAFHAQSHREWAGISLEMPDPRWPLTLGGPLHEGDTASTAVRRDHLPWFSLGVGDLLPSKSCGKSLPGLSFGYSFGPGCCCSGHAMGSRVSPDISSVVCCRGFFGRGGRFQQRSEILSKGAQKAPFLPAGPCGKQRCRGALAGVVERRQRLTQKWLPWATACQMKHDSSCGDTDTRGHFDEFQSKGV